MLIDLLKSQVNLKDWVNWLLWGMLVAVFFGMFSAARSCGDDANPPADIHRSIVEQIHKDVQDATTRHEQLQEQVRNLEIRYYEIQEEMKADERKRDETHLRLDGALSIDDIDAVLWDGQCVGP